MRTSTIVAVLAVLIVAGGAWYYYMMPHTAMAPTGAAGINGSPNQGNLGQPDNGQPQQPGGAAQDNGIGDASQPGQQPLADGAEGMVIGNNVALGTDANATLGTYLIAYNGMTLYTYAPDAQTPGKSACSGQCAALWPPYIAGPEDNVHQVKAGVNGTVDTIVRADGKAQVTYNGKPLYFYVKDTKSGDTVGQGVGGVWFVVKP